MGWLAGWLAGYHDTPCGQHSSLDPKEEQEVGSRGVRIRVCCRIQCAIGTHSASPSDVFMIFLIVSGLST